MILHKLLSYSAEVSIPDEHFYHRKKIKVRVHLAKDCTPRCKVFGKQCYLNPDGTLVGLPTAWNATWISLEGDL